MGPLKAVAFPVSQLIIPVTLIIGSEFVGFIFFFFFQDGPIGECKLGGRCVILGLWPCSYCSCKAVSLVDFCLQSCPRVLSECSTIVSHLIFCLFFQSTNLSPLTKRATRKGSLALFILWSQNAIRRELPVSPKVCHRFILPLFS